MPPAQQAHPDVCRVGGIVLCAPCKPVMPKPGCTPPPSRSSLGCVRTSHPGGSFPIAAVTPTFVTLCFCSSQARNGSHGAEIKVLAGPPSLRRLPGRSPVFASSRFWGLRVPCSRAPPPSKPATAGGVSTSPSEPDPPSYKDPDALAPSGESVTGSADWQPLFHL